jgi:hypothetical protein
MASTAIQARRRTLAAVIALLALAALASAFSVTPTNCTTYLEEGEIAIYPGLGGSPLGPFLIGPLQVHMWYNFTSPKPIYMGVIVFNGSLAQVIYRTPVSTNLSGEFNLTLGPYEYAIGLATTYIPSHWIEVWGEMGGYGMWLDSIREMARGNLQHYP